MARGSDENGICARYQGDNMSDIYGIRCVLSIRGPFAVEGRFSERMEAIKVFSDLKLLCFRTHAPEVYQPPLLTGPFHPSFPVIFLLTSNVHRVCSPAAGRHHAARPRAVFPHGQRQAVQQPQPPIYDACGRRRAEALRAVSQDDPIRVGE